MLLILRSEKLIPFLHDKSLVFFDNPNNFPQIMRPEAMIDGQSDRLQPEFRIFSSFCNVDMRRLIPFFGIKVQIESH